MWIIKGLTRSSIAMNDATSISLLGRAADPADSDSWDRLVERAVENADHRLRDGKHAGFTLGDVPDTADCLEVRRRIVHIGNSSAHVPSGLCARMREWISRYNSSGRAVCGPHPKDIHQCQN